MTLTTINLAALGDTINLSTEVTGTLATGNGGTGATTFAPGKIGQIVSATTDTQVSNADASYTMMSQAITPSATSSSVLVFATLMLGTASNPNGGIKLTRGGTALGVVGNPHGGASNSFWSADNYFTDNPDPYTISPFQYTFLDTGISTTSATTYAIATESFSQLYLNRPKNGDADGNARSTFTLMEVLA